jgi:hypothetical protein
MFGKPVGALDAAAVCQYFGRSTKNAAATMADLKRQPGFPTAIKPWGARGHERWNIEELDAWRLNECPRASALREELDEAIDSLSSSFAAAGRE